MDKSNFINKSEVSIRPYHKKDREKIWKICTATASVDISNPEIKKLLLTIFCNYYIDCEPFNCFVASNDKDEPIGYILCSENAMEWANKFRQEYMNKTDNELAEQFMEGSCTTPLRYAEDYPAHLHIDILSDYQRMGLGSMLMNTLIEHLKNKGISGLMLSVGADNEKGIKFYEKYGFSVLSKNEHEIAMGIRLD